jgi:transposase
VYKNPQKSIGKPGNTVVLSNINNMKKKKFRDYQPDQIMLFPPSVHDWLPPNHLAHFINEVVYHIDLSAIYDDYSELTGQPPYDPTMMVKILIYAQAKGINSSRKIEQALYEDIGFRFLSCNQQPNFWTISEFRRRHRLALENILCESIRLADESGFIKMNQVAVDGTKIKANASKHSAMSYGYMVKEEERLKKSIQDYLDQLDANDRDDDENYGDNSGWELPEELSTAQKRLEAIKKAKAALETEAIAKAKEKQDQNKDSAEKQGKGYKPRKDPEQAKPEDKDQYNFTDPESRIMKNSDKAFVQAYNAQATVDVDSHIILAADVTDNSSDRKQLQPQVQQVEQNTGRKPGICSADAGYFSENNLEYLESEKINALIPPDKIKHSEWRAKVRYYGPIPKNASRAYRMRRILTTKQGRALYKHRMTSVEPVFGFIKEQLHLRQFLHRGIDKVRSIWRFTCGVHNLLKLYRAGIRFQTV